MAGRGPAPKDPSRRVRRGNTYDETVLTFTPAEQPPLPDTIPWSEATREFWAMLRDEPIARMLTAADWEYLMQTAVLHWQFWEGDTSKAAELRIRLNAYGVSLSGRASLRLQFAEADEKDAGQKPPEEKAKQRYQNIFPLRASDALEA